MSSAGWCCHDDDGNGFWYTDQYPEEVFFEHWTFMAERYLNNPLVIGADQASIQVKPSKENSNSIKCQILRKVFYGWSD